MTVFQGIVLGLLQGVAEFLPISSSGHLSVAKALFGLGDVPVLFDVTLHVATLCAVVLYFRAVIWRLLCVLARWVLRRGEPAGGCVAAGAESAAKIAVLAPDDATGRRTIVMILVTTAVTGGLGVVSAKIVPDVPAKAVCAGFLMTAALLVASALVEKHRAAQGAGATSQGGGKPDSPRAESAGGGKGRAGISLRQALAVGVAQGIGTLPGISRSGSTIAGALFFGVDRVTAGDYSFIVSIPAILGAFVLELKDLGSVGGTVGALPLAAGCLAAFVSGFAALAALMRIIRRGRLEWFAAYLVPAGILGIMFL